MPIDSLLAPLLVMLAATLAAAGLLLVPFFRHLHAGARSDARYPTLDGYRGYLAVAVLAFHAYNSYFWLRDGNTIAANSHFFIFLGKAAVAQFFLITGFLFWGKALDGRMRLFSPDPVSHLVSRAWRLGPLYLFAVAIIVLIVAGLSHFALREPLAKVLGELARLAPLGALTVNTLNGIDTERINGVRWTLHYEWVFYLVLPVLALLATHRRFIALLAGLAFGVAAMQLLVFTNILRRDPVFNSFALWFFIGGMTTAHLVRALPPPALRWVASPGRVPAILLLAAIIAFWLDANALPGGILVNVLIFIPIACGNSLLGLLHLKTSRVLSTLSYSIYLMHAFLLFPMRTYMKLSWFGVTADSATQNYWLFIGAVTGAVIAVSAITYRWLEHPYLHRKLHTRRAPARPPVPLVPDAPRPVPLTAETVGTP